MKRLDHYLTRKAEGAWPGALVFASFGRWTLERPSEETIILADEPTPLGQRFQAAREALYQLIRAAKARA